MIKISFDKIPWLSKLPQELRNNPKLFILIIVSVFIVLVLLLIIGGKEAQRIMRRADFLAKNRNCVDLYCFCDRL